MKVKYSDGDICAMPLTNGFFAICHIVFASKEKFRKTVALCLLSIQDNEIFDNDIPHYIIPVKRFGKEIKVIFTGNQNIINGFLKVIDHIPLNEEEKLLRVFNYAGGLYEGDKEIRRIPVSEFAN